MRKVRKAECRHRSGRAVRARKERRARSLFSVADEETEEGGSAAPPPASPTAFAGKKTRGDSRSLPAPKAQGAYSLNQKGPYKVYDPPLVKNMLRTHTPALKLNPSPNF